MAQIKTSRPFQQRFLDGFNRSQLRQEVQKGKRLRFARLRTKYATLALGASLALGGLAVPMRMVLDSQSKAISAGDGSRDQPANASDPALAAPEIVHDLQTAQKIAAAVAGGVQSAAQAPLDTVSQAPQEIAQAVADAPKAVLTTAEAVKEHFFQTRVPFGSIIYRESMKNDLPPELVAAVVRTESKFLPNAHSQAGAIGLMQLVPQTGHWMGARDLTNPGQNIAAGAKYLRYLYDRFHGDEQKAIAAFNAGEGNVRRFGGVPPFRETRNFVSRVQAFRSDLSDQVSNHASELGEVVQ